MSCQMEALAQKVRQSPSQQAAELQGALHAAAPACGWDWTVPGAYCLAGQVVLQCNCLFCQGQQRGLLTVSAGADRLGWAWQVQEWGHLVA